ncbi:MAG: hypothetical protein GYB68_19505 [Chloroflexi bacterium]|nr:hypothetical protein [Chloroflexota bacterium]
MYKRQTLFGTEVFVDITVLASTPTPTATATAEDGDGDSGDGDDSGLADLVVETVSWDDDLAIAGSAFEFNATISNDGDEDAAETTVEFTIDGLAEPLTEDVPALPASASITISTGVTIPTSGTYGFTITVDPDNAVGEADEENNSRVATAEDGLAILRVTTRVAGTVNLEGDACFDLDDNAAVACGGAAADFQWALGENDDTQTLTLQGSSTWAIFGPTEPRYIDCASLTLGSATFTASTEEDDNELPLGTYLCFNSGEHYGFIQVQSTGPNLGFRFLTWDTFVEE